MKEKTKVNENYYKQIGLAQGISFYCKKNCPRCYGKGYIGIRVADGKKIPCKCVVGIKHQPAIKNLEKTLKEKKES